MSITSPLSVLLTVSSFFIWCQRFSQSNQQQFGKIPVPLIREDLSVLKDSLIAFHPGMYRYANHTALNQLFDSTINAQNQALKTVDIYATVRYLISAIKDGHTKASLPDTIRSQLRLEAKMFPAHLYFGAKKTYLACDAFELPAGTEILSIDNIPIIAIRKKLLQYIRSDGNIITKKYWDINFGDSPFPYLYYLVYGAKDFFKVSYRLPSNKSGHKILPGEKYTHTVCVPTTIPDSPTVKTSFTNKGIAVLKISAFANNYPGDNFSESLRTFFDEVRQKEIQKVIVDLRDNGGGQDIFGALLYSYLTTSPFQYYRSLNSTQKALTATDHPNLAIQQPKENAFTGKLYILINGQSFSSTTEFCSIVRSNNRATFIGVETGGGYYGNTSGPDKELILPHSKITIKIPLYQYVMEVKTANYPDRGIFPDYPVEQDMMEFNKGKDKQYDFAFKLALSQQ